MTHADTIFNKVTADLVAGRLNAYDYAEIVRKLDGEYCDHRCDREYVSNGNEGGFSSFETYCNNCGHKLTENDL